MSSISISHTHPPSVRWRQSGAELFLGVWPRPWINYGEQGFDLHTRLPERILHFSHFHLSFLLFTLQAFDIFIRNTRFHLYAPPFGDWRFDIHCILLISFFSLRVFAVRRRLVGLASTPGKSVGLYPPRELRASIPRSCGFYCQRCTGLWRQSAPPYVVGRLGLSFSSSVLYPDIFLSSASPVLLITSQTQSPARRTNATTCNCL